MGDKPVDAKIIKKTQDSLGRIIKKPPLTDKLLQKPPFRFLHDIVTSVIKTTGFMKGLFTDVEMNSDNVKDKENKITFLEKLIDMVSLVNGKPISAKPSKIVAGHDADRTNELLQALAEAINKKVDNDDYVRRVLKVDDSKPSSKKESSSSSKSKDKEDSSRRSKDRKEDGEGDRERSRRDSRSKDRSTEEQKGTKETEDDSNRKERTRHSRTDETTSRESRSRRDNDSSVPNEDDRSRRHRESRSRHDDSSRGRHEDDESRGSRRGDKNDDKQDVDGGGSEQKLQRPSSAKGSRRHQSRGVDESHKDNKMNTGSLQDEDTKQSTVKTRPARPSSARPAPPKPKKNDVITEEPVIAGGRKVPNVIVDKKEDSDDDDDDKQDFLGKDDDADETPVVQATHHSNEVDADGDGNHGGLVKKILETKKELESSTQGKKTQIDRSQVSSDATRRKERDAAQHEIDRLRGSVQTLTRSVNPLGKILDFLQEDLDAMQKEMVVWRQENRDNTVALQREQSVTESSVEPLKAQLTELDSAIRDQLDLIAAVKSTILHNDSRISKMLGTVTKS